MSAEEAARYGDEEDEEDDMAEEDMELDLDENNMNGPGLTLDVDEDDAEAQRSRYGLNSPKGDSADVTPATKFRTQAGINSPKSDKTMDFSGGNGTDSDADAGAGASALAGLVTQVKRGDDNPITSVSPDDDASGFGGGGSGGASQPRTDTDDPPPPQTSGCCSCFGSLFSCFGSGSSNEVRKGTENELQSSARGKKPAVVQRVNSDSKPATEEKLLSNGDGSDGVAGQNTLKSHDNGGTSDTDDESSTEYGQALLPPIHPDDKGKKCLVLDLDETLVHSSFKKIDTADFVIPVEIDNVIHRVYVMKRPYVDEFLVRMQQHFELVIFTASLSKYADPLLDQLDTHRTIRHRLFRESCTLHRNAYVKDMRRMGRKLKNTIIVDNSAQSYLFQPKNAVPIASWFDDKSDTQLIGLAEACEGILKEIKDVRNILNADEKTFSWLVSQKNAPASNFE